MRTFGALLLFSFLASSGSNAQEPRKVDCHKDLKEAYELIDARWSFLVFKPGYVDLEQEYRRLENEAKNTKRPDECADIIARFMAKLGDGHSSLQWYPEVKYTTPKIELRTLRERLSRVPGEHPKPHIYVVSRDTTNDTLRSILPGSEIVAVNGQPMPELHSFRRARVSGSTDQWRDYVCDRRLLRGPANEV
ncbi:MAG: hypothetical protein GWN99_13525, partial [Gemmatimonadetes bacterium]|nr:hypothetical protein [Gemmatimonadota bacterium]NIR75905.1 hypothetical protein [Candidatus Kutchimonas denitrificans]NIS02066.1 hypothetical protein [Gemmatimonadota bacterium]NIT67872.1 hypothetical protein [Gemmatimonadota bacterium]NIU53851.1 hypothetical protein [Gemmatimonadota bacterium]